MATLVLDSIQSHFYFRSCTRKIETFNVDRHYNLPAHLSFHCCCCCYFCCPFRSRKSSCAIEENFEKKSRIWNSVAFQSICIISLLYSIVLSVIFISYANVLSFLKEMDPLLLKHSVYTFHTV